MLQKPDLSDALLAARLRSAYALRPVEIAFLPVGMDQATALYRIVADDGRAFFLRLRSRGFDAASVMVPRLLADQGVRHVIPPVPTTGGRLWTRLAGSALMLYPFVQGSEGYAAPLTDAQWVELGTALRDLHAARLPRRLSRRIPRETFSAVSRDALRQYLARAGTERFDEPDAAELTALLRGGRERVTDLLRRADALGDALRARAPAPVLCHGDMHAGNVLIEPEGTLHVVDWDTLAYAPPEHDFEMIDRAWGGARGAELFYRGYGLAEPDQQALQYYRYRRVVEDLKVDCELLLDTRQGGANRAAELAHAVSSFRPGGHLDVALELDTG